MERQQTNKGGETTELGAEKKEMEGNGRIYMMTSGRVTLAISPAVPATQHRAPDIFPFLFFPRYPHLLSWTGS